MKRSLSTGILSQFSRGRGISQVADYFVSNLGDDGNDGKSPEGAWQTIAKVNSETFDPGDVIAFRKGDTWREELTMPSSGTAGNYIKFTSYGTGDNPEILGSNQASGWSDEGGNVWKSSTVLTNPYASTPYGEVFFIETDESVTWGVRKANTGALAAEYDWTWDSNNIYVYAATDPTTRYNSVEAPQRDNAIHLNAKSYIEINGIDMFYCKHSGVQETYPSGGYTGYILRNCHIAYLGTKDGAGHGSHVIYNETLIENNVIHDVGRRGVSLNHYGSSNISNVIVQNNIFYNGFHTTGVDISSGAVAGASGDIDNVIVRYNLIYDDPNRTHHAISIFVQKYDRDGNTTTGIYIYGNIIKHPLSAAIQLENIDESFIYHNTFYGHNEVRSGASFHVNFTETCKNAEVKNNIFYTLLDNDTNVKGLGLRASTGHLSTDIDADNNLYWRASNLRIIGLGSAYYYRNNIAGVRTDLGWEANSPDPADPLFVSASDLSLQEGSSAIHAGADVGITHDYNGDPYNAMPSLGAIEHEYIEDYKPTLTVAIAGINGSVEVDGTLYTVPVSITAYDTATIEAIPTDPATSFIGWTGSVISSDASETIYMNGNKAVTASFETLGAEMVANGTFDENITGWTGTNWAWETDGDGGGWARHTAGSTGSLYTPDNFVVAEKKYRLTFTVGGITAGSVRPRFSSGSAGYGTSRNANGTYTEDVVVPSGSVVYSFYFVPSFDFDGYIDDISIREVT